MWEALKGKKTYVGLALGAVVVVANAVGIPLPDWLHVNQQDALKDLYQMALAACVRHGISTGA
jgi:hypothetical protein